MVKRIEVLSVMVIITCFLVFKLMPVYAASYCGIQAYGGTSGLVDKNILSTTCGDSASLSGDAVFDIYIDTQLGTGIDYPFFASYSATATANVGQGVNRFSASAEQRLPQHIITTLIPMT
jgi:hypothetical protein